jgi:hypothetical protein
LETFLRIIVQNGPANSLLDIAIGSAVIGQLQTDSTGSGTLRFGSIPDEPGELPLPAGFSLAAGATIGIGSEISGLFGLV